MLSSSLPLPGPSSGVAGVLLAAGAGRRMGQPKGLLRTADGTPWVARATEALAGGGCRPILAVVGAEAEPVRALVPEVATVVVATDWEEGMAASLRAGLQALAEQTLPPQTLVGPSLPPQAQLGQALPGPVLTGQAVPAQALIGQDLPTPTAVAQAAVTLPASTLPISAVIVTLVDTPGVTAATVERLVAVAHRAGPGVLARAAYDGVPGHPVLIGREHWAGVMASAKGDAGARGYLAGRSDVVLVESADIGSGEDIDTPDELL